LFAFSPVKSYTCGQSAVGPKYKEQNMNGKILMPNVFGFGHSAGQTESDTDLDGNPVDSNWRRETISPRRVEFLYKSGLAQKYGLGHFRRGHACRVDENWREDLLMLKKYGVSGLRCSLNWPRMNPAPGKFDKREFQRVQDMLDFANELGIKISPTIWWWDEPGWCDDLGSWEKGNMVEYLSDFTAESMHYIGNRADDIDTLNELTVFAMFSRLYFREGWPAQYPKGPAPYRNMLWRGAEAHAAMVPIIRSANPNAKISVAHAAVWNQSDVPYLQEVWDEENFELINLIRKVGGDNALDRIDLNLYMRRIQDLGKPEKASWDGHVGYDTDPVQSAPCEVHTSKPWRMVPEALYHVPMLFWKKFGLEIRISEHGYPTDKDHEDHQVWDAAMSIFWLDKTRRDGVKVGGAFLWSLFDNFEWGEGKFARFGYFEMNYETQVRTPRPAMEFIRDCISAGGITQGVWKKWESRLRKFPLPDEFLAMFE
jgi:beta-glucosidase